ncbi:MAG: GNAT family N-acetyltransferase [Nanoarchaeota archaeon]|nr:GNAT family N-acetyltransferase [Nanoarchaeota archaeon]
MGIEIEKAIKKDLEKIAEIFKKEFSDIPYKEKWTEKQALERIKCYYKNSFIFCAKIKNKILGFVIFETYDWYDGKRACINEIVVSKESQGKGIGKALIKYSEDYLKNEGVKDISLTASTKAKSFLLYKKIGYKEDNYVSLSKILK